MEKIEHIGIAVKSLEESNKLFAQLFGKSHYKVEAVESEGVSTSFFEVGPNKIELLEATKLDSPIAKFIEKNGEGIHHIAFAVDDIEKEIKSLGKNIEFLILKTGFGKKRNDEKSDLNINFSAPYIPACLFSNKRTDKAEKTASS